MKLNHAACLLALLPSLALAQTSPPPDTATKDKPFAPIIAREHAGAGRIGVRLAFDKTTGLPLIVSLTRGGPAADFGFHVGDVIVKIDKNYTSTLTQDEVRLALHGDPGSGVELTFQRDDNPKLFTRAITRRVPVVDAEDKVNPPMSGVAKE